MFDEVRYTQGEVDEIVEALQDELVALESRYSDSVDEVIYLNRQFDILNGSLGSLHDCHNAMLAFLNKEGIDWNCRIY